MASDARRAGVADPRSQCAALWLDARWYCPLTGRIHFLHNNVSTKATVRTFTGSVSQGTSGAMHMAGTFNVLNVAFGTVPLSLDQWLDCVAMASLVLWASELRKLEFVAAEMKRQGANMSTLGSLTLCRSLLEAGLVDRFRVVMFPVITGKTGSERIYDGYPDVALDMVASRAFDGRIQLVEYVPTVLSGPPGAG